MKSVYDVMQLLKRFGIYVYTKDRVADLEIMEEEIKELYTLQMIQPQDFQQAVLLLRQEKSRIIKTL
ncbi:MULTISPECIES: YqgQ family protein [unclassified Psychrobacillus]|uniref:YqgQ family protein n=1 Tax=unclassified Psychrobacillus TaxID=2636677 RepID=UPI00146B0314|nr:MULTISPECIES: YqgQ family protein [unclassified Psychrobacillus]MCM3358363.1 YqgQ family protein [Psychrobacillus sp. MER TA 171]NME04341.1 YqgQ family protein [Psychrobacillus sp. BL-248-WT-3]